jgi:hypothetical protein
VFCLSIGVSLILLWRRMVYLKQMIHFLPSVYFNTVIFPGLKVMAAGAFVPVCLFCNLNEGPLRLLLVCLSTLPCTAGAILLFGITAEERIFVRRKLESLLKKARP